MGQQQSTNSKIPVSIKLKKYEDVKLTVPYSQLDMIKVLQSHYEFEIKGALYFDHSYNFKSFDIRTDNDRLACTGGSDWKIYFHTHPDQTSQIFGLRYYSPPSADDVMEIYDHYCRYVPKTVCSRLGELSIIIANEGIYVMQLDRQQYEALGLHEKTEEQQEEMLNNDFNAEIILELKKRIADLYDLEGKGKPDYSNPDISYEQFSRMLKVVCDGIHQKFGFKLKFHDWTELKDTGLQFETSSFFVNKKVED